MNRHFLACAALFALAGASHAQSGVNIYGVLDTNLGWGSGSVSDNKQVGTGGLMGSRLGFRGTEDLGDGLKANFVIEHGLNSDTGMQASPAPGLFWNRLAYVGLGSRFGDVNLGRQYTPTFLVHATYDAFGPQGVAAQQVLLGSMEFAQPASIRAANSVSYLTPNTLGGFALTAMVSANEGSPTGGKYTGLSLTWQGGSLSTTAAFARYYNPALDDLDAFTLGARYSFGAFTLYGLYDRANSGNGPDSHGVQVSGTYTVGVLDLKASIARSVLKSPGGVEIGSTQRAGVGFVYNLSKRTALYGQYAHLANSHGAAAAVNGAVTGPNEGANGVDLGIRHAF
ncbi:porin [Ideonella sp. YS5]|uniref:porin n=1 Tax=Ideonella sp. YS5 TaxID=3453714 RepID=UPI003EEDDE68